METKAIVVIATAWGTKFGGLNSFSTELSRALAQKLTEHRLVYLCKEASPTDLEDARKARITLLEIASLTAQSLNEELALKAVQRIRSAGVEHVDWWIGHDLVTGPLALQCRSLWEGSRLSVFMHMSYQDYAFVKHPPADANVIDQRIDKQKMVLSEADVGFAVGPLLYERLKTIRGDDATTHMIIPGLIVPPVKETPDDRLHAITFGRFDVSEALIKQAPLAVAAFARAFRHGIDSNILALKSAYIRVIGAPKDVVKNLRDLANTEADRVVNLQGQEFVEDKAKLRSLLGESNVCMMLSWHEGFGLSGWEAIASGVPLILSQSSGLYQLLDSLGGTAMGCVYAVDVRGSGDGAPKDEDIKAVTKIILAIASEIPKAKHNAKDLQQMLRFKCGFSWARAAIDTAVALDISVATTFLDMLSRDSREKKAIQDSLDSAKVAKALRVLDLAKSHYNLGQYSESLETIESLKDYECLLYNEKLAFDAVIQEAEVFMRLNQYPRARSLVGNAAQEAHDRGDWLHYVRARAVENVILRDQGEYAVAVALAEKLLDTTLCHCKSEEESVRRLLARSYALNGSCDKAASEAMTALKMAKRNKDRSNEAKSALALGEAYRHGNNIESAAKWYRDSQDLSGRAGHVDCLLWSLLGLSDCEFLQDRLELASHTLQRLASIIGQTQTYPLESLHMRLSVLAIEIVKEVADKKNIELLLADYRALGIRWPVEYFDSLIRNGSRTPKHF